MIYSNFFNRVWYIPESERESPKPSSFLLQSPNYRLYTQIGNSSVIEGIIPEDIDELLLNNCVLSTTNIENLDKFSDLPQEVKQDIIKSIIDLFYPSIEFIDKLDLNLILTLDSKFSNSSWDCKTCQEKQLDKQRNCPYLDKEEYHDQSFTLYVGDNLYTTCPMNNKDNQLISLAFEAFKLYDKGFLPENGSFGDQPLLFCILAQKVKDKYAYYEHKQLEESKSQLK